MLSLTVNLKEKEKKKESKYLEGKDKVICQKDLGNILNRATKAACRTMGEEQGNSPDDHFESRRRWRGLRAAELSGLGQRARGHLFTIPFFQNRSTLSQAKRLIIRQMFFR